LDPCLIIIDAIDAIFSVAACLSMFSRLWAVVAYAVAGVLVYHPAMGFWSTVALL